MRIMPEPTRKSKLFGNWIVWAVAIFFAVLGILNRSYDFLAILTGMVIAQTLYVVGVLAWESHSKKTRAR